MNHKTATVIIQEAQIDVRMIPFVKWLNRFNGLTTEYCCQGQGKYGCYVLFRCFDWDSIKQLATILRRRSLHMDVFAASAEHPYVRFRIDFGSTSNLIDFIKLEIRGK